MESDVSCRTWLGELFLRECNVQRLAYRPESTRNPRRNGIVVEDKKKLLHRRGHSRSVIRVLTECVDSSQAFPGGQWRNIEIFVYDSSMLAAAVSAAGHFERHTGKSAVVIKVF